MQVRRDFLHGSQEAVDIMVALQIIKRNVGVLYDACIHGAHGSPGNRIRVKQITRNEDGSDALFCGIFYHPPVGV